MLSDLTDDTRRRDRAHLETPPLARGPEDVDPQDAAKAVDRADAQAVSAQHPIGARLLAMARTVMGSRMLAALTLEQDQALRAYLIAPRASREECDAKDFLFDLTYRDEGLLRWQTRLNKLTRAARAAGYPMASS